MAVLQSSGYAPASRPVCTASDIARGSIGGARQRHFEQFAVIVALDDNGPVVGLQAAHQFHLQIPGIRPRRGAVGQTQAVFIEESGPDGDNVEIK